ncbi:MAG: IS630 family transposase [Planctomycetota bacterium]|nr:IS630 family transposase [Planctomycetota bacterium]
MDVAQHLTIEQLKSLVARETNKRRYLRLRAVVLALEGRTAVAIADALGCSRRAVQNWIRRYNDDGADACADRPRPGRPAFLSDDRIDQFRARIDAGARLEDRVAALRAKDIRDLLEREFGVIYTIKGVYRLLHRLGYSCLEPRPRHIKSDPARQEEFKKKSPDASTKSRGGTPIEKSRSGSRTRRGSAKRGR